MELSWLLCNKCFVHMTSTHSPFSLTQCGHLFCKKCTTKLGNHCPVCNTNGVQVLSLSTPLQPMISPMFRDPQTMISELSFAVKFQKYQLQILAEREKELSKKYLAMKTTYWQTVKEIQKMEEENRQIKEAYKAIITHQSVQAQSLCREPSKNRRVNFVPQNMIFGNNLQNHNISHLMKPNDSEDSDTSDVTMRGLRTPKTPDGLFRVPKIPRIPRSVDTSNASSIHTPMSDYKRQSSGYASDSKGYFRR